MSPAAPRPDPSPVSRRLDRIAPDVARMSRWLYDRRFAGAWRSLQPALTLAPMSGAPERGVMRLRMHCDAGEIEVLLTAPDIPALDLAAMAPDSIAPDDANDAATAALTELAASVLFAPFVRRLREWGAGGLRAIALSAISGRPIPRDGWCRVRARGQSDVRALRILRLPAEVERLIVARVEAAPAKRTLRSRLCLRAAVALAERRMRRALLASLRPGDVVLLAGGDEADPGATPCTLRWGCGDRRWRVPVLVGDTHLRVEGELRMEDGEFDDTDPADGAASPDEAEASDPTASLEVPVRFELDTIPLSLASLESLAPGQTIELATPLAGAMLRVVACGRTIGAAELVAVGDRLGARIVRMGALDAAGPGL